MYLFLHVPKTAGTSLRKALKSQFLEYQVAQCYGRGEIPGKLQRALNEKKQLIYGHISFEHLRQVDLFEEYQLLAFFRHPVQRCISTYIHFLTGRDQERRKETQEMDGFAGFLQSDYGRNWQCQYIGGAKHDSEAIANPEQLFELARQNFEALDWVGVTERYTESLISLKAFMGLKNVPYVRTNVSRNRELKAALEGEFAEEIIQRNKEDLKLWKLANQRLDKQLAEVPFLPLKKIKYSLLKPFGR